MDNQSFETPSLRMERGSLLTLQAPGGHVDRIMGAVIQITPLTMGHYDSNAFQSAPGVEHYRPLEGAAAGAESEVRKRSGIVEVSFELPDDQQLIDLVIEATFQTHSYQEPLIRIETTLSSRSKGRDDKGNPNRWWDTMGDWKKSAGPPDSSDTP